MKISSSGAQIDCRLLSLSELVGHDQIVSTYHRLDPGSAGNHLAIDIEFHSFTQQFQLCSEVVFVAHTLLWTAHDQRKLAGNIIEFFLAVAK
jgi:hypothetical protein